jgi:UMF1 family MFS transporter
MKASVSMRSVLFERKVLSWAFYDWANSAFATTVLAGFFPVFFKQYWSVGAEATVSTFRLGLANGAASFILAVLAPLLGAIADRGRARIRFLASFTALGVAMTAALYFVGKGQWQAAAAVYVAASLGFWGGIIFYDSLLVVVAPRDRLDLVSGYGYSLGYLGGGLLFAVNVWMTLAPQRFGLVDAASAVQVSFVTVAVWWAVFALPVLFNVKEERVVGLTAKQAVREGFSELIKTVRELRRYRAMLFFLFAYWLYIDGVNTIQKMAVDYGLALGFPTSSLISALLLVQFIGFPAALFFGWLGNRINTLLGIYVGIAVYAVVTVWAVFMSNVIEFYGLAVAIGLVQGGVQSLSRSYFGSLVPTDRAAEFFGFYNMMGKFAAVLGPVLMGVTALLTGSSRLSILSLVILFIAGALLLEFARRERIQGRN